MVQESLLLTKRETEVINKKLSSAKLTQQDSNYLSRFVRPKLREMNSIDSRGLLNKLDYNPKAKAIEKRLKQLVLKNLRNVSSITIYGSVVYNNYHDYNDIDVLVIVKKKFWKKLAEKYQRIVQIKKEAKRHGLNLDLEVYDEKTFCNSYPINISLVYQLKNRKTIYGALKLPSKVNIPRLELRMKVDFSIVDEEDLSGLELYRAIRNSWLVNLALDGIIDNIKLNKIIEDELGINLVNRLRSNNYSRTDKKIGLLYLEQLLKDTLKRIKQARWAKISISNP
ncbi:hypothetical protein CMO89_01125 [Candidatus Woesearchaeota archaeon]|nr:hypothetical protein [Candidatus Woesearchaeota archaeon]|tara:strand:+ start:5961 stop:6806 length:846 start_codon:yes stop_codon:yes gene_type:complete